MCADKWRTFCRAESAIKSCLKAIAYLLHGGKHAVDKLRQILWSNNERSMYYDYRCICHTVATSPLTLNTWFTANGLCVKNNTHIYVARTSNNRVITARSLLLLAAKVCSFAHLPLGLSDRNNTNAAIDGRSEQNQQRLRITLLNYWKYNHVRESLNACWW